MYQENSNTNGIVSIRKESMRHFLPISLSM